METLDRWLQSQIEIAVADLARQLNIVESTITVARAERVTWRDGSLGCPQPGMGYNQALVPGSFIQLAVDGAIYNYHGGRNNRLRLCDSPFEVLPESLPSDPYM